MPGLSLVRYSAMWLPLLSPRRIAVWDAVRRPLIRYRTSGMPPLLSDATHDTVADSCPAIAFASRGADGAVMNTTSRESPRVALSPCSATPRGERERLADGRLFTRPPPPEFLGNDATGPMVSQLIHPAYL